LLLAYQSDPESAEQQNNSIKSRLANIRTQGYEVAFGETIAGVNDLAVLIGTASSAVKAALTIASFAYPRETFVDALLPALQQSALAIGRAAGMIRQESGFRSQNSSSSISQ
jgi:DNA-binding IclR family transcriptional regulator